MVTAVDGAEVTLNAAVTAGTLAFGRLLWLDGPNCGVETPIAVQAGVKLVLAEPPPLVMAGLKDLPQPVRLVEGCDKQLATCDARFHNALNFRGEAHLPGNDLLTRYPGG